MAASGDHADKACTACKFRKRRCPPDCPLAPYFPANDDPQRFKNVHRFFGVRNIVRILEALPDPSDKRQAMESLVFDADVQAHSHLGSYGIIRNLEHELELLEEQTKNLKMGFEQWKLQQEQSEGQQPTTATSDGNNNQEVPFAATDNDAVSQREMISQEVISNGKLDASTDLAGMNSNGNSISVVDGFVASEISTDATAVVVMQHDQNRRGRKRNRSESGGDQIDLKKNGGD